MYSWNTESFVGITKVLPIGYPVVEMAGGLCNAEYLWILTNHCSSAAKSI